MDKIQSGNRNSVFDYHALRLQVGNNAEEKSTIFIAKVEKV
jgi:hypothetical protein